ncbi:phosphatidate cytidylyltransferase [bacterium]|jgi:phosphatidate cytidylyltransferase|nr:phosphatidate cytidylyltransferase [bacterium]
MKNVYKRVITGIVGIVLLWLLYKQCPTIAISIIIAAALTLILIFEWPKLAKKNKLIWLLTPLYPIAPCILLILLNHSGIYRVLFAFLLISVFAADTGAYFIGTKFGKHLIAPRISPKKSWEGLIGSAVFSYIILALALSSSEKQFSHILVIITSIAICIVAFAGDLFESYLKRKAKIKDSGSILPGHGGLLDRLDSILFVAPFFYFGRTILMKLFGF